jgi:hypothetical protein
LELLLKSGQVKKRRGRFIVEQSITVDTRADPKRARALKAFWAKLAVDRLASGADGLYSYNLFSVSRRDLERLRELHRAYFRALRAIIATSRPAECVALASINLLELSPAAGSAGTE